MLENSSCYRIYRNIKQPGRILITLNLFHILIGGGIQELRTDWRLFCFLSEDFFYGTIILWKIVMHAFLVREVCQEWLMDDGRELEGQTWSDFYKLHYLAGNLNSPSQSSSISNNPLYPDFICFNIEYPNFCWLWSYKINMGE